MEGPEVYEGPLKTYVHLGQGDPMLTCLINQTPVQFMVDTDATVSTTGDLGRKPPPLSTRTLTTMGFSGTSEVNIFTQPLQMTVLGQTFYHSLLYAPKCPTHLLGRDVLSKLNCHISCHAGGTMITSPPDGPWAHPLTSRQMVMIQEPPQRSPPMDIYWLRNLTTPVGYTPIQNTYLLWKAWILQQGDYDDPIDPPHTTLNATPVHDDVYQNAWDRDMEGTSRSCTYREIYLGPEDEPEDPEVKAMLDSLPNGIWATGPYDMGYTPQHKIHVPLKQGANVVHHAQYRVKDEVEAGITKTIEGLKAAGVLRLSDSPWNTPILPVKKADGVTWRMAHDLRAINEVTEGPPETVPNPQVALHGVTPDHQWFTCIDLANAFFCLPLDEASQPLFAFTWGGEHLTYTRMPQGYRSTPTIFNWNWIQSGSYQKTA